MCQLCNLFVFCLILSLGITIKNGGIMNQRIKIWININNQKRLVLSFEWNASFIEVNAWEYSAMQRRFRKLKLMIRYFGVLLKLTHKSKSKIYILVEFSWNHNSVRVDGSQNWYLSFLILQLGPTEINLFYMAQIR